MQQFLRKYGVQTTLHFVLYEVDGVDLRVDAVDAGADCSIMKDEGAETTCANDFADEGTGYSLIIGATEMEAAEIMVYIVDTAAKVWLDEALKIETYGHASAMHAMDLDTVVPTAAVNADAVWDESLTGASHNLANSAGKRLRQVSAADIIYEGGVASATASTVVFDAGPNTTNDFYDHCMIVITEGTGIGQSRTIDGWVGGTLTATIHPNWITNPAADSVVVIFAFSETHVHQLEAAVLSDIQAEMEENGASILDAISDLLPGSTIAAATDIPTMVGTNGAALASVVGALDNAAADGDPTNAETLMQYLKQLINILVGTAGVVAFPGEAAPANAVSLAEVIRAIHADVTGLNGSAMIGTASAALASVCTEARLAELAAANLPTDIDTLLTRITAAVALASICTEGRLAELDAANLPTDIAAIPTTMVGTDNAALAAVCTEARLAELAAANLPADVDAIKAKTDNQPAGVPKNVALANFMFLMMDSADHITPKTGLTITEEISKDGGAFAAMTNTFAEVSGGMYKINIIQTEMNAAIVTLKFTAAGADDRLITIITSS